MANRWGNSGNCNRLYFLGLQNHCRWWLQPWNWKTLAPWKKSYDKSIQRIKKLTNVCIVKAMLFPVVMYGCESWTIKKAELQRIDAFELWCWRRLLRVAWTARRSNQSILKEINPEYSLEGLMLKLKFQYLGTWCKELIYLKDPGAGKHWRREEKGVTEDEMVGWYHWLSGREFEQTLGDSDGQGRLSYCSLLQRVGHELSNWITNLYNWMQLMLCVLICFSCVLLFATLWTVAC